MGIKKKKGKKKMRARQQSEQPFGLSISYCPEIRSSITTF
jgi:hypothetical protein